MLRDLFSLFPACAGVIPGLCPDTLTASPFPRMRGGDPYTYDVTGATYHFSPHARG